MSARTRMAQYLQQLAAAGIDPEAIVQGREARINPQEFREIVGPGLRQAAGQDLSQISMLQGLTMPGQAVETYQPVEASRNTLQYNVPNPQTQAAKLGAQLGIGDYRLSNQGGVRMPNTSQAEFSGLNRAEFAAIQQAAEQAARNPQSQMLALPGAGQSSFKEIFTPRPKSGMSGLNEAFQNMGIEPWMSQQARINLNSPAPGNNLEGIRIVPTVRTYEHSKNYEFNPERYEQTVTRGVDLGGAEPEFQGKTRAEYLAEVAQRTPQSEVRLLPGAGETSFRGVTPSSENLRPRVELPSANITRGYQSPRVEAAGNDIENIRIQPTQRTYGGYEFSPEAYNKTVSSAVSQGGAGPEFQGRSRADFLNSQLQPKTDVRLLPGAGQSSFRGDQTVSAAPKADSQIDLNNADITRKFESPRGAAPGNDIESVRVAPDVHSGYGFNPSEYAKTVSTAQHVASGGLAEYTGQTKADFLNSQLKAVDNLLPTSAENRGGALARTDYQGTMAITPRVVGGPDTTLMQEFNPTAKNPLTEMRVESDPWAGESPVGNKVEAQEAKIVNRVQEAAQNLLGGARAEQPAGLLSAASESRPVVDFGGGARTEAARPVVDFGAERGPRIEIPDVIETSRAQAPIVQKQLDSIIERVAESAPAKTVEAAPIRPAEVPIRSARPEIPLTRGVHDPGYSHVSGYGELRTAPSIPERINLEKVVTPEISGGGGGKYGRLAALAGLAAGGGSMIAQYLDNNRDRETVTPEGSITRQVAPYVNRALSNTPIGVTVRGDQMVSVPRGSVIGNRIAGEGSHMDKVREALALMGM